MRRLGAALLLALVATTATISVGGRPLGQARAAGGGCVEHTKRVVGHVKRHGKRVRVVRAKRYRTCEAAAPASPTPVASAPSATASSPVPTPATSPSAPAPTLSPPALEVPKVEPPPGPEPEPQSNALGVAAEDKTGLHFSLSREVVQPGKLVVQLTNQGEDPHTMDMQRVGEDGELEGPVLAELAAEPNEEGKVGSRATVEVQPGTYRMWCTIGHHAEHGMTTVVTVE